MTAEEIEKLKVKMTRNWRAQPKPYESYELTNNTIRAADQLKCIRPMFGYLPSELQKAAHREQSRSDADYGPEDWANWNEMSAEERLAVSFQKLIRQRFTDPDSDSQPPAGLAAGLPDNTAVQGTPQEEVENLPQSTINGCFFYKASHAQELMESRTAQPTRVEVVKIIQLSAQQFQHFSANLLRDMPFIAANKDLSGYDKGVTRCLLVTTRRNRDGILVNSEGYNYARYPAI